MSDCVYHAYAAHMKYLFSSPLPGDYGLFCTLRLIIQGNEGPLWGGIVPWVIHVLTSQRNVSMRVQHRMVTPHEYLYDVRYTINSQLQHYFSLQAGLVRNHLDLFGEGVDNITLKPAIYLMLAHQHAVFAQEVPTRGIQPVMAIQLMIGREKWL